MLQFVMLVSESCHGSLWPMGCSPLGSSVLGDSPVRILGGLPSPSPGTSWPGSNPDLARCRQVLDQLSHQGSLCHSLEGPFSVGISWQCKEEAVR